MPSLSECLWALLHELRAYRFRPFATLTASDVDALLED